MESTAVLMRAGHGVPVRTLRVFVVGGPDEGASCIARSDTLAVGTAADNDLVLTDDTVSRYHLELTRVPTGVLVADSGSTNGTRMGDVRIERAEILAGAVITLGQTRLRVEDGDGVLAEAYPEDGLGRLRGRSDAMKRLMAQIVRAAEVDAPVLIVGESGTGKELIARALHGLSSRLHGPFETLETSCLPPTSIASELFGHERGAFVGADKQHAGAFERACGGTLFLDEVAELPGALQSMLLGAITRKRIRRLGGRTDVPVDVRIVSATHRDLRASINSSSFRHDLYYRLAVLVLRAPPLRDRLEDIPLLVEHFARGFGYREPIETLFSRETFARLATHPWPGNVRELRNLVQTTLALGACDAPTAAEHPFELLALPDAPVVLRGGR